MNIAKYLRRENLVGSVRKRFKNREIIPTHEETRKNEQKWGDYLFGWKETAGLQNSLIRWFQPYLLL